MLAAMSEQHLAPPVSQADPQSLAVRCCLRLGSQAPQARLALPARLVLMERLKMPLSMSCQMEVCKHPAWH